MATRAELDAALIDNETWRIKSALMCDDVAAFAIMMRSRVFTPEHIRMAWDWFQEGYQCGVAMSTVRRLRTLLDEQQG